MQLFGIAVGCMGMTPETFWNGLTIKEWWSAYTEWNKIERIRLGLKPEDETSNKSGPITDEEMDDLFQQEREFQKRLKLKKETKHVTGR